MKANAFVLWSVVALQAAVSLAEETSPAAILKKVVAAYESLDTYSAEGTVISDLDTGGAKVSTETSFSMKLKKPSLYQISWASKGSVPAANSQSGAVWNDGTQPYLYMSAMKAYSKMSTDEITLGGAIGISGGAALTVPSLFLAAFKKSLPFSGFVAAKLEGDEAIDSEDCYVISGHSTISKKQIFWISKTSYLIRKYSRLLEPPAGGVKMPTLTDQQLEGAIKASGQQVTKGNKEAMRKMMKQAQATMKTSTLKGTSTEFHTKIETAALADGDLVFKVPADTVLKESLFEGTLHGTVPAVAPAPPAVPGKAKAAETRELKRTETLRTFTAKNEKSVKADFLSFVDGKVRLRREDGKTISVPFETFCAEDQDFIRRQQTAPNSR